MKPNFSRSWGGTFVWNETFTLSVFFSVFVCCWRMRSTSCLSSTHLRWTFSFRRLRTSQLFPASTVWSEDKFTCEYERKPQRGSCSCSSSDAPSPVLQTAASPLWILLVAVLVADATLIIVDDPEHEVLVVLSLLTEILLLLCGREISNVQRLLWENPD